MSLLQNHPLESDLLVGGGDLGLEYGFWWIEWGGQLDTIKDNERIRDDAYLISVVAEDPNDFARRAQIRASSQLADSPASNVISGQARTAGPAIRRRGRIE